MGGFTLLPLPACQWEPAPGPLFLLCELGQAAGWPVKRCPLWSANSPDGAHPPQGCSVGGEGGGGGRGRGAPQGPAPPALPIAVTQVRARQATARCGTQAHVPTLHAQGHCSTGTVTGWAASCLPVHVHSVFRIGANFNFRLQLGRQLHTTEVAGPLETAL